MHNDGGNWKRSQRYPGYDVLAKHDTLSWNSVTCRVIDARLAMPCGPRFFAPEEWKTLNTVCDRIAPQPKHRPPIRLQRWWTG